MSRTTPPVPGAAVPPGDSAAKKPHIIRRLYNWVLSWADSPYGPMALVIIAFAESSFFPIPPDVLLIALALGMVTRAYRFAFLCSVASVLGGIFGYGIGVFAWETVGEWVVTHIAHANLVINPDTGHQDIVLPAYFHRFGSEYLFGLYEKFNAWIVFVFGLTPLPYKLVTITAGVARVNFWVFVLASIASRSLRFFLVAYLIRRFGPKAKELIDRYFDVLSIVFVLLLIGGFVIVGLLL